ncbi:MAG: MotA/TolQ/ExbB proton channel family protein [Elusimicrobia bacterium]|nr:MotA/TolQ/ExbB proton channel family protein [Elusimicrobiota bacterium]
MGSSHFALKEMLLHGWYVLSVLLACSVISLAVMWDRWVAFRRAGKAIPQFLKQIASKVELTATIEGRELIARTEITRSLAPLENRLSILGTIASITPFIGLLGTVIGIIRAFRAVSATMSGGHAVVAVGIAEALVATAAGLLVAIPAVVGYNYFSRKLEALEQQLTLAAGELIMGLVRK